MKKFKYESGKIVTEEQHVQELVKSFLALHFVNDSSTKRKIEELKTIEDADNFIKTLWVDWTYDPDTKIIEE